ncbi:MAG: hypothetical protein ACLUO4_06640 [Christensenellales bacterium]
MPIVSSQYWNSVHGNTLKSRTGLNIKPCGRQEYGLVIRCIDQAKDKVPYPEKETKVSTNFIR